MSVPAHTPVTCPACGAARFPGAQFCTGCGHLFSAAAEGRKRRGGPRREGRGDLVYITVAALLAVVISHLPFVNVVAYPFKLFGTFVHEWSHALVALATGGGVVELQINANLSGETLTRGGAPLLIWSAGYTGAAIIGACLLLLPVRFAKRTLIALGSISLLLPLWSGLIAGTSFPPDTWLWALIFGVVTLGVGIWAGPRVARLFQQFVAIELCLTTLDSLRALIWLTVHTPNVPTDAYYSASYTHVPALFWAGLWSVIALVALGFAAVRVVRRSLV